jgi:hypothetical protein
VVLEAIEAVVQVEASVVLEVDSVEALEAAVSQAVGNPCKSSILLGIRTYQSSA